MGESAYLDGKESVKLNKGPYFGEYRNVHRVHFNYTTNPPSFRQINVTTKDSTQIKRSLVFKASPNNLNNTNHQNAKIKKKKKRRKHSNSKKPVTPPSKNKSISSSPSLLSNIKRI